MAAWISHATLNAGPVHVPCKLQYSTGIALVTVSGNGSVQWNTGSQPMVTDAHQPSTHLVARKPKHVKHEIRLWDHKSKQEICKIDELELSLLEDTQMHIFLRKQ